MIKENLWGVGVLVTSVPASLCVWVGGCVCVWLESGELRIREGRQHGSENTVSAESVCGGVGGPQRAVWGGGGGVGSVCGGVA